MIRREFPEAPIVAVGAVIIDGDNVLLVRRAQEPLKGEWSLPGGVVELGESLEAALRREVREETGLLIDPVAVVEALSSVSLEGAAVRYHYVIIDFLCRVNGGFLARAGDVTDARWVGCKELNSGNAYGLSAAAAAVIAKAFHTDPDY